MSKLSRRDVLRLGSTSAVGVGLRAALTGLPVSFLLHRRARADGADTASPSSPAQRG